MYGEFLDLPEKSLNVSGQCLGGVWSMSTPYVDRIMICLDCDWSMSGWWCPCLDHGLCMNHLVPCLSRLCLDSGMTFYGMSLTCV